MGAAGDETPQGADEQPAEMRAIGDAGNEFEETDEEPDEHEDDGLFVEEEAGGGVEFAAHPDVHAGTRRRPDGQLVAAGGRVLNVCAEGDDIAQARERAYAAVRRIDWPGGFSRSDIGWRALEPR